MTETTTAIKPNYKQTKLGWIPEEWKVKPISSVGKVITGSTPKTDLPEYYGGDYLFVSPSDIQDNKFVFDTKKKLTKLGFSKGRKILKGSTLFVAIGSTIGKAAIAGKDLITNQQINSVIANEKNNDEFIYYQLTFNAKRIALLAGKQAVPIINKTLFSKILVPCPPLPEQQKIATILSTWDRALAKQQRLIAAKQQFKKGLMQLLLTGKKRFEGFEGVWKEVKLGELTNIFDGTHFTPKYVTNGIPFYSVENISRNDFKNTKFISQEVFEKENKRVKIETNDILMTRIGDIGTPKLITWDVSASFYVSLALIKKTDVLNSLFLEQFIKSDFFQKELFKRTIHVAFPKKINLGEISNCIVRVPNKNEQQKIATVLSAADKEIVALQKQLLELQSQKQALMLRLLTGEIRAK